MGVWLLYKAVLVSTTFKMNRPHTHSPPPFGASFPIRSLQYLFPAEFPVPQRRYLLKRWSEGIVWQSGMGMYILLYFKWKTNKHLLLLFLYIRLSHSSQPRCGNDFSLSRRK